MAQLYPNIRKKRGRAKNLASVIVGLELDSEGTEVRVLSSYVIVIAQTLASHLFQEYRTA